MRTQTTALFQTVEADMNPDEFLGTTPLGQYRLLLERSGFDPVR